MTNVVLLTYDIETEDVVGIFSDFDEAEKRIQEEMETYGLPAYYYRYYRKTEYKVDGGRQGV